MKKIILFLLCLSYFSIVYANNLDYYYLPYYVKINDGNEQRVLQVKKIYDKDTLEVVFNMDYFNYSVDNNFNVYKEVNRGNYGIYYNSLGYFNTIVYYGYNLNKTDLNYFLTQLYVWQSFCNNNIRISDEWGNEIKTYTDEYISIANKIAYHNLNNNFYYKTFESEIWDTFKLNYSTNNIILDNPDIDGLNLKNNNYELIIDNLKVGLYTVNLFKKYEQLNYSYTDGINIYWQNLGGPENISKQFNYNVRGLNFVIKENPVGINGKFGDAILDSKYELYLNDELKLIINSNTNEFIKSNSNYVLKDKSINKGFFLTEDIYFSSFDNSLEIVVDKYVVFKNISVSILDNKEYYVYLKSNNLLYEVINDNTNIITLPNGTYYIVDKDNKYYKEIFVLDDMDEELIINNKINENILDNDFDDSVGENNDNLIIKENVEINDKEIENPKTLDNIYLYVFLFLFSIIIIVFNIFICNKFYQIEN